MLFDPPVPRHVVPLGTEYGVDDDGFLSIRPWSRPTGYRAISEISSTESLAVLGEPGIGKSTAIEQLVARDRAVVFVRLAEAVDVRTLDDLLGLSGTGRVQDETTLVLDGVDECPLPAKALIRRVDTALRAGLATRVVVGCRTADWVDGLEDTLSAALGQFALVEMLPLSRDDVAFLAGTRGVDSRMFLRAVRRSSAVPLATLPLSLDLLLSIFQARSGLPESPAELYHQGLMLLAGDPDAARAKDKKPPGTDAQRFAVAARIAAFLMLCGRGAVATGPRPGDSDLATGSFVGGGERLPAGEFPVTPELVDGTLSTALFAGRGPKRLGLVHASFAAYLTARYLTMRHVSEQQLRALLTRTSSLGRTSVPARLRETAGWLVALDAERNEWLIDVDPDSIAAHSGLVTSHVLRARLVDYLLGASDLNLEKSRRRWRLGHPDLAEQLRPVLRTPLLADVRVTSEPAVPGAAVVAAEIARRARDTRLVPDLVDLLACPAVDMDVRTAVAYALLDLDRPAATAALRVVLEEVVAHPEHDPEDDLRGIALDALWPANLSASELVTFLIVPRGDALGAYQQFLVGSVRELDDEGIEEVVRACDEWLAHTPHHSSADDEVDLWPQPNVVRPLLHHLGDEGGGGAVEELLHRAMSSPLLARYETSAAALLAAFVRQHGWFDMPEPPPVVAPRAESDATATSRRAVIEAALHHLPVEWAWLLASPMPLSLTGLPTVFSPGPAFVGHDDLDWLFGLGRGDLAPHAAALIRRVFRPEDTGHHEIAWQHRAEPLFANSVGPWFDAIEVTGEAARSMREEFDPSWRWLDAAGRPALLRDLWAQCQAGEPGVFADLCDGLQAGPVTADSGPFHDDITTWGDYHLLNANREELLTVALAYLTDVRVWSSDGLEWERDSSRLIAGYVALAAFARDPDEDRHLVSLPDAVWRCWIPAVLWYPTVREADPVVHRAILSEAVRRLPDVCVEETLGYVEARAMDARPVRSVAPLDELYDEALGDRLLVVLRLVLDRLASAQPDESDHWEYPQIDVARGNARRLGGFLRSRQHAATAAYIDDVLGAGATSEYARADARIAAALVVLDDFDASRWSGIFDQMRADEDFGFGLAYDLARRDDEERIPRLLDAQQLADLWRWLKERSDSPAAQHADFRPWDPDGDQRIRHWRFPVLTELARRDTSESLHALAALAAAYPHDSELSAALDDAEARERERSWLGPDPDELGALLADARRTIVHDDDALYRAVLASLERFARRLDQVGQLLWNEVRADDGSRWRPKYEADVSAALRDHFEQEFGNHVVVNREVLVRQTTGAGHGLSVDVLVTGASAHGRADTRLPRCPIEVKGSWHRELITAVETQLVNDYARSSGATRAVYVCAWYSVDEWNDESDPRRAIAASRNRASTARELTAVAERLSATRDVLVSAVVFDVPRPTQSRRTMRA